MKSIVQYSSVKCCVGTCTWGKYDLISQQIYDNLVEEFEALYFDKTNFKDSSKTNLPNHANLNQILNP